MLQLIKEFWRFAMQEKKWWLIPLIGIIVLLGLILFLSTGSGISWALYPGK